MPYPRLIPLLLITTSCGAVAIMGYNDFQASNTKNKGESTYAEAGITAEAKTNQAQMLKNINKAHLFGKTTTHSSQTSYQKNLPETRLQLTLLGTFTHEQPEKASALIAKHKGNAKRYYIGDDISGAELIAISAGEVTLRRNGQDELLKLPILSGQQRSTNVSAKRTLLNSNRRSTPSVDLKPQMPQDSTAAERRSSRLKERLEKLRNKQKNN